MKLLQKLSLIVLFVLIVWLAIFAPIGNTSTTQLFLTCYGITSLLALAFIYVDKKKGRSNRVKKIILFSLAYGTLCFLLFWII